MHSNVCACVCANIKINADFNASALHGPISCFSVVVHSGTRSVANHNVAPENDAL